MGLGKKVLIGTVVLFVAIELIPVERTNPPVEQEIDAPEPVLAILRRSCYDCHSHQTRWPWYSRVAPVSWLVAHDVEEGREHLNFSTWNRYSERERKKRIGQAWEEIEEGEMPLWTYLLLHGEARLSDDDKRVLEAWAKANGALDEEGEEAEGGEDEG